ncbi:hypothetical protein Tcan_01409, partial [Toxocara canis]
NNFRASSWLPKTDKKAAERNTRHIFEINKLAYCLSLSHSLSLSPLPFMHKFERYDFFFSLKQPQHEYMMNNVEYNKTNSTGSHCSRKQLYYEKKAISEKQEERIRFGEIITEKEHCTQERRSSQRKRFMFAIYCDEALA